MPHSSPAKEAVDLSKLTSLEKKQINLTLDYFFSLRIQAKVLYFIVKSI